MIIVKMNLCPCWVHISGAGGGLWVGLVICNCQPIIIHISMMMMMMNMIMGVNYQ